MKNKVRKINWLRRIGLLVSALLAGGVSVQAELQIEKAYCGVDKSWCDLTVYLQQKVRGNSLSTDLAQPFDKIGVDPAPNQVKYLIIDYRLNQVAYRLVLKEHGPIAFPIRLPSVDATAPGRDAAAMELMKAPQAPGVVVRVVRPRGPDPFPWSNYWGWGVGLLLAAAVFFFWKARQRAKARWLALEDHGRRLAVERSRRRQRFALVALAALVTAVAFFYLEEDWRGKRAWEKCKAELEAKGIVMDWAKHMPSPVAEDQNFFMANSNFPIRFKKAQSQAETEAAEKCSWFKVDWKGLPTLATSKTNPLVVAHIVALPPDQAKAHRDREDHVVLLGRPEAAAQMEAGLKATLGRLVEGAAGFNFSEQALGHAAPGRIWLGSETPPAAADLTNLMPAKLDINQARLQVEATAEPGKFEVWLIDAKVTSAAEYLKYTDVFLPALAEIREALKRPYAIPPGDYSEPYLIPIPNFVTMRTTAQLLAMRAQCHLLLHDPGAAVDELAQIHELCRILQKPAAGGPETLVAAMINVAIGGLYVGMIRDGFRLGEWREPELAALQGQLKSMDLPEWVAEAFREENAATAQTFEHSSAEKVAGILSNSGSEGDKFWDRMKNPLYVYLKFAPRGWIYQNLAGMARLTPQVLDSFDLERGQIHPRIMDQSSLAVSEYVAHPSLFKVLATVALPNFAKAVQTTAANQTLVNQAQIVCGLERYRLEHGEYPGALEALAPRFLEAPPHDVIGGQPLRYRRTDDGKFLLYSVGWNETDDGGTVARKADGTEDREHGDWVWTN